MAKSTPETEEAEEAAGGNAGDADGDEEVAGHAGDESPQEESEVEDRDVMMSHLIPSYPFPADFNLEFQDSRIEVCRHLCQRHPRGTRAVALFFPGVHGGVGPCRQPGENFDDAALFPTVARGLVGACDADVDCYRCSWPHMRPQMAYAVGGVCRVLHHALLEAMQGTAPEEGDRELRVFFVGHSLGGAVAVQAAEVVSRHFGPDGLGGQQMEGLEHAVVRVAGICTLNGAMDVRKQQGADPFASLSGSRALVICGDADDVVPPEATERLHEALPMRGKRQLVLPGGTHDLFTFKAQLVEELTRFVLDSLGGEDVPLTEASDEG